jgi:hypothetical protein
VVVIGDLLLYVVGADESAERGSKGRVKLLTGGRRLRVGFAVSFPLGLG